MGCRIQFALKYYKVTDNSRDRQPHCLLNCLTPLVSALSQLKEVLQKVSVFSHALECHETWMGACAQRALGREQYCEIRTGGGLRAR